MSGYKYSSRAATGSFLPGRFLISAILIMMTVQAANAKSPLRISAIGDFQLENGQIINNCKIGYRTFGKLNADSSNIILNPTWFSGTTGHLASVCAPGKIVDSTRYFIVALAALGNGESSSPSNSKDQPGSTFPHFNIRDMVHSQFKMLQKEFGFKKVFAVVGGSMGSMQAYEWLVQYPDFMDRAVLYVASPKLSSSDLLLLQLQLNIIEMNKQSPDSVWANIAAITRLHAYTSEYVTRKTRTSEVDSLWQRWLRIEHKSYTLQDYAAQSRAMYAHNIFAPYAGNDTYTAQLINAKVMQILSKRDQLVNYLPALEFGKLINAQTMVLDGNCGHLEPGCQMKKVSAAIQDFLNK